MNTLTQQNGNGLNAKVKEPKSLSEIVLEENIKALQREVVRLNNEALVNSVKFERMKSGLFKMLEQTETRFDIDGKFGCVEDADEYLDIAIFCQNAFGRLEGRIQQVQEWYNEQIV